MADLAPDDQKMKQNKTESEYNMKSIKVLSVTTTAILMCIAYVLMLGGFSVIATYYDFDFFYDNVKSGPYLTLALLCAVTGLILKGVTIYGLSAVLSRSICRVNVYVVLLSITIIFKFVVVILAYTFSSEKIGGFLHLPVADYTTDPEFQDKMNALQNSLGCCGSNSFIDYFGLELNGDNHTAIIGTEIENGEVITVIVPFSCCPLRSEQNSSEVICLSMWARGCKQALTELLLEKATIISIVGIAVMFVNMLGIVFALLLARCIKYTKSESTELQWKIKEQSILAEQADEKPKALEEKQPVADHDNNTKKDSSQFSF